MKYYHALSPALIGISIVLVQSQVAVGLSATQVEKIAREITVKIVDSQNTNFAGSGIIIKRTGNVYTVLTAGHVVKEGKKQIITPDKQTYQIKNVKLLQGLDLAVGEFNSNQKYTTAKIGDSDEVKNNSVVYVAGFPAKTAAAPNVDFRMKDGKVDAKGSQRDGYDLSYDNRTSPGMSGGAILNEQGELIGIHGRPNTAPLEDNPEQVVISGALGTTIYSSLRQMLALGVDVGVKPPNVVATAPTADDFFLKAREKYDHKDYKGAIGDLTEAIRLNPNYVNAYSSRGLVRYESGDKQGAIADFNTAIKINPNYVNAYVGRGAARNESGDKQGAIADFNTAIKINPNYAYAYVGRGAARNESGDKQGAIADFNTAIKINPKYALAYVGRGNVRYESGDSQGALADYNTAIKINPKELVATNNIGLIEYEQGNFEAAMKQWQAALAIENKAAEPLLALAVVLYAKGERGQALTKAKQALTIDKRFADVAFLKKNLWSDRLITDAKKLLTTPEIQRFLSGDR